MNLWTIRLRSTNTQTALSLPARPGKLTGKDLPWAVTTTRHHSTLSSPHIVIETRAHRKSAYARAAREIFAGSTRWRAHHAQSEAHTATVRCAWRVAECRHAWRVAKCAPEHVTHTDVLVFVALRDVAVSSDGARPVTCEGCHDGVFLFVRVDGARGLEVFGKRSVGVDRCACRLLE